MLNDMITIKKTQGVQSSDYCTCVRLQELIFGYKEQCPIGKVIIDAEKMTFFKFGIKMGICRHATNGIVYDKNGSLKYVGIGNPIIYDQEICRELFRLFNLPF